jgi:hypothetical protein
LSLLWLLFSLLVRGLLLLLLHLQLLRGSRRGWGWQGDRHAV